MVPTRVRTEVVVAEKEVTDYVQYEIGQLRLPGEWNLDLVAARGPLTIGFEATRRACADHFLQGLLKVSIFLRSDWNDYGQIC